MPREEASTIQFIWCSIWKRGDSISGAVENELSTLDSFLQRVVKTVNANPPNRSNSPFGAANVLLRAKSLSGKHNLKFVRKLEN